MKKTSGNRQIILNIIWHGLSVLLSAFMSFAITPYITNHIGIEANGFVTMANNCISYIDIIACALNAFAARYIALAYHNDRNEEADQYYSSVIIANLILAFAVDMVCTAIIWKLQYVLNISDELCADVKLLFFLVLINYSINIIGTVFSAVAFIKNMTSITYRNKGISTIINAVTLLGLIYFTQVRIYYMAIGNILATIFNVCVNYYYTKVLAPDLKFSTSSFSLQKVRRLFMSGIWNSINNLGNILNSGLDLLVCNKMLSPLVMGQISISKQISIIMTTLTGILVTAFQPKQLEEYAKGNIQMLSKYLNIAMKAVGIFGNAIFACFFVLGEAFLELWIPGQDIHVIYRQCIIVFIGDILVTSVRPLYYVYTLTDKLKSVCWITITCGVINVLSMIVLINYTNLEGYAVVGTTAILNLIMHFWATPYFAGKYLSLKKNIFMQTIVRHICTCFCVTGIIYLLSLRVIIESWSSLICYGVLFGGLSIGLASILELTKNEKKALANIVKNKLQNIACNRR